MPKQKLQWTVEPGCGLWVDCWRAELWDRPYNGSEVAATRWTASKGQARRDGRKVFSAFEELKYA